MSEAAQALRDAAAEFDKFAERHFESAKGLRSASPTYQRGAAYEQAAIWLRERADKIEKGDV